MKLSIIASIVLITSPVTANVINSTSGKVVILGMVSAKGEGVCSGVFIDDQGTVLTCAHCFSHPYTKIFVKNEAGRSTPGAVMAIDNKRDLALVATEWDHTPYVCLGRLPKLGDKVYSFGAPLGIQHTVSQGHVENILDKARHIIIHSAFISPGNSGGPLIDESGRLVGINEAVLMQDVFQAAQGLFIAISIEEIRRFLEQHGTFFCAKT